MKIAYRQLVFGLVLGCSFATLIINIFRTHNTQPVRSLSDGGKEDAIQKKLDYILSNFVNKNGTKKDASGSLLPGDAVYDPDGSIKDKAIVRVNDSEVKLAESPKVKILIFVLTMAKNLRSQAKAVNDTWGPRADKLLFMSTKRYSWFPTIGLGVKEGRGYLTAKTMKSFRYVYENHFDDYDWFMKADDDTYVIMENLRLFLSVQNTNDPVYFGSLFVPMLKQGYFSGGGGYVLSKEALRRLYEKGDNPEVCEQTKGSEDLEVGRCLEKLGVKTGNTTDVLGRSRFHGLGPHQYLKGGYMPDWYHRFDAEGGRQGKETISDLAISFHAITSKLMYNLDFFLYHLRPRGLESGHDMSLNSNQGNRLLDETQNLDYKDLSCLNNGSCKAEYGRKDGT